MKERRSKRMQSVNPRKLSCTGPAIHNRGQLKVVESPKNENVGDSYGSPESRPRLLSHRSVDLRILSAVVAGYVIFLHRINFPVLVFTSDTKFSVNSSATQRLTEDSSMG